MHLALGAIQEGEGDIVSPHSVVAPESALGSFPTVGLVVGHGLSRVVESAARHIEQATDEADRLVPGELHDKTPSRLSRPGSIREAFFRISIS